MKITIYGVGLIGGSLALCFKGKPGMRVVGHSANPKSIEKYITRGVVDEATLSFEDAAADADFIFLCVPVGSLAAYVDKLKACRLKSGCIVTDVGSTKGSITAHAKGAMPAGVHFIGGHPMAGKEKSGVEAATSHLFENAYYVLTPEEDIPQEAVERLEGLLALTKAKLVRLDPRLHDEVVGGISHLPHILAVALVNQVAGYGKQTDLYRLLAAGGFRDTTRIASSDPVIWRDILLHNREVLLRLLKDWNRGMDKFIQVLEQEDGPAIEAEFRRAGAYRNSLPERGKGIMDASHDLYVDIPDQPGIIGSITSALGTHRINLGNIQIMENRLDVPGVLRLSFRHEEELLRARDVIEKLNCEVHF